MDGVVVKAKFDVAVFEASGHRLSVKPAVTTGTGLIVITTSTGVPTQLIDPYTG